MKLQALAKSIQLAVVAVVTGIAALSIWYGTAAALADSLTLQPKWLVGRWRTGQGPSVTPELWNQTRDALQSALSVTPGNPQLYEDLGFLYGSRAQAFGTQVPDTPAWTYQQSLLVQAQDSYRGATVLRPNYPYSWLYLALAKHQQGKHDAEFWHAFDNALTYGYSEAAAQPIIASIAFSSWADLGLDRQGRVSAMVTTAQPQIAGAVRAQAKQLGVQLPALAAL